MYGWAGRPKTASTGPSSTMRPAYITATRSARLGHDPEVVGDEDEPELLLEPQPVEQLEDLRLDDDVERGGRLVGHDHARLAARQPGRS